MKFKCGRTQKEARVEFLKNWHPWFAWWPVEVADADCRWLETVERKFPDTWLSTHSGRTFKGWDTVEYRSPSA